VNLTPSEPARTILLTGVTRGLGRALTDRFIEKGHTVWGCGRNGEQIARLQQRFGPPHDFARVNVADDAHVADWARRLLQNHPAPDFLLNNAAVINALAPLWEVPAAEFDALIDINIKGVTNVIRHFVPAMIARGAGIIINFSSGWGRSVSPEVAPYCASKFAVEGLSKALAEELPSGMASVPLNPGIIDSDMLRASYQEAAGHYPDPEHWSHGAADYILRLGPSDSGLSRTIPQ
jgi:NAD(P)-dependent dehydrogenase (short-subunit alcohol dehydrogenase family)